MSSFYNVVYGMVFAYSFFCTKTGMNLLYNCCCIICIVSLKILSNEENSFFSDQYPHYIYDDVMSSHKKINPTTAQRS